MRGECQIFLSVKLCMKSYKNFFKVTFKIILGFICSGLHSFHDVDFFLLGMFISKVECYIRNAFFV
jgi:hypothetical protein